MRRVFFTTHNDSNWFVFHRTDDTRRFQLRDITILGLLDLATMAVREIDLLTEGGVVAFHWAADGRTLAYDYLPASGYRRVKGYDIELGEGLVVPRTERSSAIHVTFESWGPRPHEVILRVTDGGSKEPRTETVTLIPDQ